MGVKCKTMKTTNISCRCYSNVRSMGREEAANLNYTVRIYPLKHSLELSDYIRSTNPFK